MPRDNDKNNGRPPRREHGAGGKGRGRDSRDDRPARSPTTRGGDRKFGGKKPFGDKRPFSKKPRDERSDRGPPKDFGSRDRGEGRAPYKPREERGDSRPARSSDSARFDERKFGEKRSYSQRDDRPQRGRDSDRGPRKEFNRGEDRGGKKPFQSKPWQKRDSSRDDSRGFDKSREERRDRPRFSRSRDERPERQADDDRRPRKFGRPRDGRSDSEQPKFGRPRFDKPRDERAPRGRGANRNDWQEHSRSEPRGERPRRENEDDSKIFTKRPAFGGRGAYRERKPDFDKRTLREAAPARKKTGERIAKIVSRAGLCSRRDAEEWIVQGRVAVNGRVINSPALDITANDVVTVDGKPLPERERTRLFLYHKPRGLMTTHSDPEGRPTVFDNLPENLPRLISVGRLDFNTEGLLLLTNDGGLARALELPDTGWLRRYRVRAHGEVKQAQLDELKKGIEVDGVKYGSIDATLERDKGANVWIVFAIREGKNREVRNVMAHLGLEVNRLIRVSYGPFQLGELKEAQVEEIKTRVLREQLGEKIATLSGAQFTQPAQDKDNEEEAPRGKGRVKPLGKSALIADRKGRRILVTRAGSDEARARNEEDASSYGPPRRPTRGYKGKRDLKPRED